MVCREVAQDSSPLILMVVMILLLELNLSQSRGEVISHSPGSCQMHEFSVYTHFDIAQVLCFSQLKSLSRAYQHNIFMLGRLQDLHFFELEAYLWCHKLMWICYCVFSNLYMEGRVCLHQYMNYLWKPEDECQIIQTVIPQAGHEVLDNYSPPQ